MRKNLIALLFLPLAGYAQFKKGDVAVGGILSIVSQDSPEDNAGPAHSIESLSIGPRASFFLNEKWSLGVLVGYDKSEDEISGILIGTFKNKESSYSVGLFGRRYFPLSEKFFFAMEGGVKYSNGTEHSSSHVPPATPVSVEYKWTEFSAELNPVLIFFPSPHWGIEASIGSAAYTKRQNSSGEERDNGFSLTAGSVSMGVNYYFRRKE